MTTGDAPEVLDGTCDRSISQKLPKTGAVAWPSSDNLRLVRLFDKGGSGSSALELSGLQLMLHAAVCDVSRLMRFRSGRIASALPQ